MANQRSDKECSFNAEFIVRSCNSHDALVNALNQSLMALVGYLPEHRNNITDAAIESARDALRSAGIE